jgi:hypothetical protein
MTPFELLGLCGLAAGGVSGSIGVLLAYAELRRWWRRRRLGRARARLLALRGREDERAARGRLGELGDELGRVEFAWPRDGVRGA